jgi:transcriptional regulator with XRE-family HTH domain
VFQHPPNAIWSARTSAEITQVDLCRLARISLSTLRNAERGIVTTATLVKLARALNVHVDQLTGRKEATL